MYRLNILVLAGVMMALSGVRPAMAQNSTVANLTVQAGNGQVLCVLPACTLQVYQPISVKATDSSGKPVSGATVSWTVTSGSMNLTNPVNGVSTTVTDVNGITTQNISANIFNNIATISASYYVATIQASCNNHSVVFTETQDLINGSTTASEIQANPPTYNGANLAQATITAATGTTLSTPILVQVSGLDVASNGVANVAVRLISQQSSPSITCASGGGLADPGSVLTNAQGLATCYPVVSGSGVGQFFVSIGGVASSNIATALYMQEYPGYSPGTSGYSFTVIPGPAAGMKLVSGNFQTGVYGQALSPLVAEVVDSGGNAVQNVAVTWKESPLGSVTLNYTTVTDNSGEVTAQVTLDPLAAAGVTITVALASNPSISATFVEAVQNAITALNVVSGSGQTAQVGTTFAQPLVVQVLNTSGAVAGYPVVFSTSGPVSISGASTVTTSTQGLASVYVLAGSTTGTGTVTATVGTLSKTFTLTVSSTPAVTPNGLQIISGNLQSALEGAAFSPLVVQVNSTAGPVAGYVVGFTSTGPISLSTGAATTNSNGQATVNVTAGSSAGAATVTASITGYSQTFNLTVTPPGLTITSASFLNAASRQAGFISPCSLAILTAPGLAPNGISSLSAAPVFGRLPKAVKGLSVTFNGVAAPILSVAMGDTNPEVTLQVPCETTPGNTVPVVVTVNGGGTGSATIPVLAVSPGIFTSVQSDGVSRAVVVRQDGSFADIGGSTIYDPTNPVRRGENVLFYMTGLGVTFPSVATDSIENPLAYVDLVDAVVQGTVQAGIVGGSGMTVVSARQAPDLIGVYEVQVTIPSNAPVGNSIAISIGIVPAGASSSTPGVFGTANPPIAIQ